MPYNAWVQICPLDQPISNSAFNDCSVTVIYSGVIITDVLLLRDGPSGSPFALIVLCRCDRVFSGLLQPLFTVVLCFLSFFFFLGFLNARLPRWPDFRGGSHGVSWPSRGSWSLTWETIAYPPPAPDQSRRSLFDLDKHLHVPSAWFHFAFKSLCHLPFTTRCACVCVWVSTHVCSLFMCTVCVCDYVCTCVFSYPCWYKLVTALAWTSLGVSAFFFFFFFF